MVFYIKNLALLYNTEKNINFNDMPITLDDFKEGGALRQYVTKIGLLDQIDNGTLSEEELLARLNDSVTISGKEEIVEEAHKEDKPKSDPSQQKGSDADSGEDSGKKGDVTEPEEKKTKEEPEEEPKDEDPEELEEEPVTQTYSTDIFTSLDKNTFESGVTSSPSKEILIAKEKKKKKKQFI